MRGKRNGRSCAGNRQAAAIDRHDTCTSVAPGSARSRRPLGTTLSDTEGALIEPSRHGRGRAAAGDIHVALSIGVEVSRVAGKRVVGVQLIPLAAEPADGLQPVNELRLGLRHRALDFGGGRAAACQLDDRAEDRRVQLRQRDARRGSAHDLEHAADFARELVRRDVGGDAALVDERLVQARRFSVRQHFGDDIELGIAFGKHRRCMPADVEPRQLDAIFEHKRRALLQPRVDADALHRRTCRQAPEVLPGELERLRGVDVPGQRE